MIAIIPAAITVYLSGEEGTYRLLIFSQVILSMQLPFAVIPLIHFTSDKKRMGNFANAFWVRALAWTAAAIIVGLNLKLVAQTVSEWIGGAGDWRWLLMVTVVPFFIALGALLAWITFHPVLPRAWREAGRKAVPMPANGAAGAAIAAPKAYKKILIPLDHTATDQQALAHGAALARAGNSEVILVHVEEDVTSQFYGEAASTAEVEGGRAYLEGLLQSLRDQGVEARLIVRHSSHPGDEIVNVAREVKPDIVVMGAHGHRGLKDVVFGATIHAVRHQLPVPLLIVQEEKS
jgi:manganese transport protein